MAEKLYLTADQFVVKCLEDSEQEIARLNDKYDELLKKYVSLQNDIKRYEQLKQMFELQETLSQNGYQIVIKDAQGLNLMVSYCFDKENPEPEFLDLLDLLGMELPKGDK